MVMMEKLFSVLGSRCTMKLNWSIVVPSLVTITMGRVSRVAVQVDEVVVVVGVEVVEAIVEVGLCPGGSSSW